MSRGCRTGRLVVALLVVTAWSLVAVAWAPQEASAASRNLAVIASGHVDLAPRLVNDQLRIELRGDDAGAPTWRDPQSVVLSIPEETALQIPAGDEFAFLGPPGQRSYVLPQVQDRRFVWPGWSTEDPALLRRGVRAVEWSVEFVRGPGSFVLFLTEDFGAPRVVFDTNEPLPQRYVVDGGTHGHGNWAFSQAGTYRLQIAMTATTGDGSTLSARSTIHVAVGDAPPAGEPDADASGAPPRDWRPWGGVLLTGAAVFGGALAIRRRRGLRRTDVAETGQ